MNTWYRYFFVMLALSMAFSFSARGEDIVSVLDRSQQKRLDSMEDSQDKARIEVIQKTFGSLRFLVPAGTKIKLSVVSRGTYSETIHGHIVTVHDSLALLSEGERAFVLAHEIGHVVNGHWARLVGIYQELVPGEVTPEKTDPINDQLGKAVSILAYRQEIEADEFALRALLHDCWSPEVAASAIRSRGLQHDTATHPGTRKRLAMVRAAQSEEKATGEE